MAAAFQRLPKQLRGETTRPSEVQPDSFLAGSRRPFLIGLGVGGFTYVAGLALAASIGLTYKYLQSTILLLAAAGVSWSVAWYLWSAINVPVMLTRSRIGFSSWESAAGEAAFDARAHHWAARIQTTSIGLVALVATLLGGYVVAAELWLDQIYGVPEFDDVWRDGPHIGIKNAIVLLWVLAFAAGAVPNVIGAVQYLRVVHEISSLPISDSETDRLAPSNLAFVASPPLARAALRHVAIFGFIGGALWTIAAGTWGAAVAVGGARWHELLPVVIMMVFGLVIVLLPQLLLRGTLVRIRTRRLAQLARGARPGGLTDLHAIDESVRPLYADTTWPHGGFAVGSAAVAVQLLPTAATALSQVLSH